MSSITHRMAPISYLQTILVCNLLDILVIFEHEEHFRMRDVWIDKDSDWAFREAENKIFKLND